MKRMHRSFFALALLAGLSVVTSCSTDPETIAPVGSISFDPSTTASTEAPGATVNFKVNVSSPENLDNIQIRFLLPGATSYVSQSEYADKDDDFLSNTSDNFDFTYDVPGTTPTGSVIKIKFIVVDKKSATADLEKEYTVTVQGSISYSEKKLYNPAAPNGSFGAYDLVTDKGKSTSEAEADKDLINTTVAGTGGFPFVKGWKASNGTLFVKAASSTFYDTASQATMATTYAAGSEASTVSGVTVNDVYVAKLRGGNNYVAIKVTQIVDDNQVGTGKNSDYIQFDYKK
ncbi:MAG: hypothetical protein H7Z75_20065 [Ferruginibacter sp.]|nr:hypothetical protein [Cytophagales bacterium]